MLEIDDFLEPSSAWTEGGGQQDWAGGIRNQIWETALGGSVE